MHSSSKYRLSHSCLDNNISYTINLYGQNSDFQNGGTFLIQIYEEDISILFDLFNTPDKNTLLINHIIYPFFYPDIKNLPKLIKRIKTLMVFK